MEGSSGLCNSRDGNVMLAVLRTLFFGLGGACGGMEWSAYKSTLGIHTLHTSAASTDADADDGNGANDAWRGEPSDADATILGGE